MPKDNSQYLFSPQQLRLAVVFGTIGMVATIVIILLLATSRPQGQLEPLDDSQFQASVAAATSDLTGYTVDGDRATIDIHRAMELVAERGVTSPGFYGTAVAPAAVEAPAQPEAPATDAAPTTDAPVATAGLPDGEPLFMTTCAACHQAAGQGIPGAFPPLAGHINDIYAADRELVIDTILFGLQGPINVNGMPYNSLMPAHLHLSDEAIAAIANYAMTAWGGDALTPDFQPYSAAEVSGIRDNALTMTDVHEKRTSLGLN